MTHSHLTNLLRADTAVKYFHLAEALYYRILESIIEREKMILGDADLSVSEHTMKTSPVSIDIM